MSWKKVNYLFVSAQNRCTASIVKVWSRPQGGTEVDEEEEDEGSFARLMHNIDEANSKHRLRQRQRQQRQQQRQQQRPRLLLVPPEVEEIAVSRLGHTFTKSYDSLASLKKLRKASEDILGREPSQKMVHVICGRNAGGTVLML